MDMADTSERQRSPTSTQSYTNTILRRGRSRASPGWSGSGDDEQATLTLPMALDHRSSRRGSGRRHRCAPIPTRDAAIVSLPVRQCPHHANNRHLAIRRTGRPSILSVTVTAKYDAAALNQAWLAAPADAGAEIPQPPADTNCDHLIDWIRSAGLIERGSSQVTATLRAKKDTTITVRRYGPGW